MHGASLNGSLPSISALSMTVIANDEQMLAHLEHLFGGDLDGRQDGLIELAWTDSETGALRHAELYGTDQLDDLVAAACRINAVPKQNVYVGQALRKPNTAPFGRCQDDDFYALTTAYVDLDDDGAVAAARKNYRSSGCPPTAVVTTGKTPHVRAQLHWRLDTVETDPDAARAQNVAICEALGGDPSVVNPSRVMRLGGSIAWPLKAGRVIEATKFETFSDTRPRAYLPGQLGKAFPPRSMPLTPENTGGLDLRSDTESGLIQQIQAGDRWHDNLLLLTGRWVTLGMDDAAILARAGEFTLPGYTIEQTARDMRVMISGARRKGYAIDLIEPPATEVFKSWQPIDASDIPPRDFLFGTHYIRKFVSGTVAPGGIGKSTLALFEAIAMAARVIEYGCKDRDLTIAYYNAEDPFDEIQRRIVAMCQHMNVNQADLIDRLFIASGRDADLYLAQGEQGVINERVFEFLGDMIERTGADVLVLDPLANMTTSPETNEVFRPLGARLSALADEKNISVEIVHHTRKLQSGGEANHEDARGGGALVNGMRSVRVLNNMTPGEAQNAGLETHVDHFRVEDGKANLARKAERAIWWRKVSIELANGDHVAAIEPWSHPDPYDNFTRSEIGRALELIALERDAMKRRDYHTSEGWAGEIICHMKADSLEDQPLEAKAWREAAQTKAAKTRSPLANRFHNAAKTLLDDLRSGGFVETVTAKDEKFNERKCLERTNIYYEVAPEA